MKQLNVHIKLVLEVPDDTVDLKELVDAVDGAMDGEFARKIWSFAHFADKMITKVEEIHVLAPNEL